MQTTLTLIFPTSGKVYSCCYFPAAEGLALHDSISIDDIKSAKTGKTKPWDGVDYAVKRD
jgi:hypothetical protein